MKRHGRVVMRYAALALMLAFLVGCQVSVFGPRARETVQDTVRDGRDTSVELESGASVSVRAGSAPVGSQLVVKELAKAPGHAAAPEGVEMGAVYEVELEDVTPDMEAVINLPIADTGIPADQLHRVEIVYHTGEQWIALPSTVDVANRTVSAVTTHFTLFSTVWSALVNDPPVVSIDVQPKAYVNVDYDYDNRSTEFRMDDVGALEVEVYAYDPEGVEAAVKVGVACHGIVTWGSDLLGGLLDHMVGHAQSSLTPGAAPTWSPLEGFEFDPVAPAVGVALEAFRPSSKVPWCLEPVRLPRAESDTFRLRLDLASIWLPEKLDELKVHVYVFDDRGTPVERVIAIPVRESRLPSPPALGSPGPDVLHVCPPRPVFQWNWPSGGDIAALEGLRFRMVKGIKTEEELWAKHYLYDGAKVYDWERFSSWGDPEGIDSLYETSWMPAGDLDDGFYTWGIMVSDDTSGDWQASDKLASATYTFAVDSELDLSQCTRVQPEGSAPPEPVVSTELESMGSLGYGETGAGEMACCGDDLSTVPAHAWTFRGSAGDTVTVLTRITSDVATFEPVTWLTSPDGDVIAASTSRYGGTQHQIKDQELPEDGLYTLTVHWQGGPGQGAYEVSLERGNGGDLGTGAVLKVINSSSESLCAVFATDPASGAWGPNLLDSGGLMDPGETRDISMTPGVYDILLYTCEPYAEGSFPSAELYGDGVPFVIEHTGSNSLAIVNRSSDTVCHVFVTPSGSTTWGRDLLPPSRVLEPDTGYTWYLAADEYDVKLMDCDQETLQEVHYYTLESAPASPPGRIEYWGTDCSWEWFVIGEWALDEDGTSDTALLQFLGDGHGTIAGEFPFRYVCSRNGLMSLQASLNEQVLKDMGLEVELGVEVPEVEVDLLLQVNYGSNRLQFTLVENQSTFMGQHIDLSELDLLSAAFVPMP